MRVDFPAVEGEKALKGKNTATNLSPTPQSQKLVESMDILRKIKLMYSHGHEYGASGMERGRSQKGRGVLKTL